MSINKATKAKREGGSQKINGFKEKLDRTMNFWAREAIERIQNKKDKLFLQSMMGYRTATLRPVDNVLATTEKKVLRRRHREEEQRKKLMQPRACHRARWTKILCRGSFQKLNVSFNSSSYRFGAPANDLDLINKLIRYREVDYAMAKKVMHKLKNHLWYVVEEMVPLSLFSSTVSENAKDRIVKKMLSYPETDVALKRNGTGYG